jgi:hypothetical protein
MPQSQEMPETFDPEAFRLLAREVLKLGLDDQALEALRQVVNGLNAEMAPLAAADLAGVEPGGWPR